VLPRFRAFCDAFKSNSKVKAGVMLGDSGEGQVLRELVQLPNGFRSSRGGKLFST
jgi:hypothetical protein